MEYLQAFRLSCLRFCMRWGMGILWLSGMPIFRLHPLRQRRIILISGATGTGPQTMLDAILQLMPLDGFVEKPVTIMDKMEMHRDLKCPVWDEFTDIVAKHDERGADAVGFWIGSRSMMRQRMPMRWYPPQRRHFMPAL